MDTNTPSREDARDERDAFDPTTWATEDTTLLLPSNLPIARVQRAWERKPASPLARGRFRVGGGKVWKRVLMPAQTVGGSVLGMGGLASPQCPTKRLRVEEGAARVSRWEARQSPVRKIVTRSALDDRLLELPLEEEEGEGSVEDEGDVTYEVLGEGGRVLELGEEGIETGHEWLDVEDEDEDEEVVNATMVHLDDALAHEVPPVDGADELVSHREPVLSNSGTRPQDMATELQPTFNEFEHNMTWTPIVASMAMPEKPQPTLSPSKPAQSHGRLPEGFVTPAKQPQRRKLGSRTSKGVTDARRKTLPVQFAPEVDVMPVVDVAADAVDEIGEDVEGGDEIIGGIMDGADAMADHGNGVEDAVTATEVSAEQLRNADFPTDDRTGVEDMDVATTANWEVEMSEAEDEWEDVGDEASERIATAQPSDSFIESMPAQSIQLMEDDEHTPPSPGTETETAYTSDLTTSEPTAAPEPVLSIEPSNADVSLRRSPRRKSTSPIKPKTSTFGAEKPHHVAFTPLRRFSPFVDLRPAATGTPDDTPVKDANAASPFTRASSAPPEEPRRIDKPRISDDTAFLHAFLKQAEERKGRGERRLSVTEKESASNRRDSDTVRQALAASPDEQQQQRSELDLVGERDGGSPSPKKKQRVAAEFDGAAGVVVGGSEAAQEILEDAAGLAEGSRMRRSGRGKRRPQVFSSEASSGTGPAKISIRGLSGSGDVVKKDEVPVLTRSNTKKNKGGSVLPKARLVKLALETIAEAGGSGAAPPATSGDHEMDDIDAVDKVGKKNRKGMSLHWAEELVSFYQGGEREVEMGDEEEVEEVRMPWERGADFDPTVEVAVPASETPSKPKGGRVRKLKAPARTAGASAKVKVGAAKVEDSVGETSVAAPIDKPAATKPRRSRIATPAAKGAAKGDLLPADLAVAPLAAPPVSEDAKTAAAPPSKKRTAGVSRLPPPRTITSLAPAPIAATTSISTGGKENLTLTSSPPKKRSRTTTASTVFSTAKAASALAPPKLDFGKAMTELKPVPTSGMDGVVESVPGLSSPAKKVGSRRAAMFGSSVQSTRVADAPPMMSLSSPAKKRGGRRLGG
ncbi:hypothetical protein LTR56_015096 [Elasticomyces elasticus]|nr:hypothetical protein LTR22_026102 [Elasticomyces elasticus]KAK3634815.1 hypothetical protein LTR56_015096 [Elasticomyces elasticus]KAK4915731.1 hypothetical protein LTR49_016215 [Elasticomyces elasticus]KAK5738268.1 hypothetical protein LTS12_025651 [Elasticomyces elasticus]